MTSHQANCSVCGRVLVTTAQGRKYCSQACQRNQMLKVTALRNRDLIDRINAGEPAAEIGRSLGVSRERVRQIYQRATGTNPGPITHQRWLERRRIERENHQRQVHFFCAGCGQPVTFAYLHKRKFCLACRAYRLKTQRQPDKTNQCHVCGGYFHPFHNTKNAPYCSRRCYFMRGASR